MSRVPRHLTVVALALLLAAPIPTHATSTDATPSDDLLSAAVGLRQAFGLPADMDLVRSLIGSTSDVGSETWGIPLTADEVQSLNLETRTSFQVDSEAVREYASSLPEFGGAYFDQLRGGQLVLQFTRVTQAITERIAQLASTDGPSTRVELVGHSFAALREAMSAAPAEMRAAAPSLDLQSVNLREPENALVLKVLGPSVPMSDLAGLLSARLGVPVVIELASGPVVPGSCPTRYQLCSPERGGVWVGTSTEGCTLGFIVTNGSDRRFVTAGHCSGGSWYQPSPSGGLLLGTVTATLYPNNRNDIELVGFPDGEASKYIFGEGTKVIAGKDGAATGELVYGSLGHTSCNCAGTVYAAYATYNLNGHEFDGTNVHNLVTQGGDSGSPLYGRGPNNTLWALATYSAGQIGGGNVDRYWTHLKDVLLFEWTGWDVYH